MNDNQKQRIRDRFPDVTDDELKRAETDPQGVAASIASRTGEDVNDVRNALTKTS